MRRKITIIGSDDAAVAAALLLARRDVADLVLVAARDGVAADLAAAGATPEYAPHVRGGGWPEADGSDVLVCAALPDGAVLEISRRSPDAVVVVATPAMAADVDGVLAATRLPRGRVVGAPGDGPLARAVAAERVTDAVLFDRRRPVRCAVRCHGEHGHDGVTVVRARIGARGVDEILG